jgi:hypothetical protein
MRRLVVLAVLAVGFLLLPLIGGASAQTTLTGSVNVTCSLGQCGNFFGWDCTQPVSLDSVTVNMDDGSTKKAIKLDAGCTGSIGKIVVNTNGSDGVDVAQGAHDLVIGGGSINCTGRSGSVHQDGVQAVGGANVTFDNLYIACTTANDAQFRVVEAGNSTQPPSAIVCNGCQMHPGSTAYHDVTIGTSIDSGVENSLVCPSISPNLTFDTTNATNPVNLNNTFPASC